MIEEQRSEQQDTDPTPPLSGAKAKVFEAFRAHGEMTDDELVARTGMKKGTASPRRNDLVRLGLIEAVGQRMTDSGGKATVWGPVPPDRVAETRDRARAKPRRRLPYAKYPLEQRLDAVRQLLDMDDVNEAMRDRHGRAWSRTRGRAKDRRGDLERERREAEAIIRRGSPNAEFYKLRRNLIRANEGVRAVRRLVEDELERRTTLEGLHIPVAQWPAVVDLLDDLGEIVNDTTHQIRDVMGVLGDDVIEGTVVDLDELLSLNEGDREADVPQPSYKREPDS